MSSNPFLAGVPAEALPEPAAEHLGHGLYRDSRGLVVYGWLPKPIAGAGRWIVARDKDGGEIKGGGYATYDKALERADELNAEQALAIAVALSRKEIDLWTR